MMEIPFVNIRNPETLSQQFWYKEELAALDKEIEKILLSFDYKLTSMPGIGTSVASKLIAEIGDIRRFPNADKLAGLNPIYGLENAYGHSRSNFTHSRCQ